MITINQRASVNKKIDSLKKRSNKRIQHILSQDDLEVKPIVYTLPQLIYFTCLPMGLEGISCELGRGNGKSVILEGGSIVYITENMPRSKWGIYAPSYTKFFGEEIAAIKLGLEMHGMFEFIHYYIGRRAPKSAEFDEPWQGPDEWKYCIHTYTGTVFQILSEENPTVAVGLNLDGLIVMEAAYCNIDILEQKVFPTVRGSNVEAFKNNPLLGLKLFFSTTATEIGGQWFNDLEQVAKLYPKAWRHIRASTKANIENLKAGYLEDMKKVIRDPVKYNAEILCIRPKLADKSFYPLFDEDIHTYQNSNTQLIYNDWRDDEDVIPDLQLSIGLDFGSVINSAVVLQNIPGEVRILKDFHVLGDDRKIQDDLAHEIGFYYKDFPNKAIAIGYDATGNNDTGVTRLTRARSFGAILEKYGFYITYLTRSKQNPSHEDKHNLCNNLYNESNIDYPNVRINAINAYDLIQSIKRAQTKRSSRGAIQKDKSSERKLGKRNRVLATDLSDAHDYILDPLFGYKLYQRNYSL